MEDWRGGGRTERVIWRFFLICTEPFALKFRFVGMRKCLVVNPFPTFLDAADISKPDKVKA